MVTYEYHKFEQGNSSPANQLPTKIYYHLLKQRYDYDNQRM